jgi:hypothetical protein
VAHRGRRLWKPLLSCLRDEGRYPKTVTNLRRTDTGEIIRWSDLSVHLIGAHSFFQGRGSIFRLEPGDLVQILFE